MTDERRNLLADLALCQANGQIWGVTPRGKAVVAVGQDGRPLPRGDGEFPLVARTPCQADAALIAEAHEGWPHAIQRALAAEAEVAQLTDLLHRHADALDEAMDLLVRWLGLIREPASDDVHALERETAQLLGEGRDAQALLEGGRR